MWLSLVYSTAVAILGSPQSVSLKPTESSFLDTWKRNLRWDLDVSQRVVVDGDGEVGSLGALGLDLRNVFAGDDGSDLVTILLQPYLLRGDGLSPRPGVFEEDHEYAVQWRIFNANLRLLEGGDANLRVGHFEIPFGLEQNLDTNGTLRRTPHVANFGFVADWGATLNGELDAVDYELGWSRGSGNEYLDRGGDGVFSGRIGTPREANSVIGASFVHGDFLRGASTVRRTRAAVDWTTLWRSWTFQAEASHGREDAATDSSRLLVEANWTNPHETHLAWLQLLHTTHHRSGSSDHSTEARLGYRARVSRDWTLSAQVTQPLDQAGGVDAPTSLSLQLRFRL